MPTKGRENHFLEAGGPLCSPLQADLGRSWLYLLLPSLSLYVTMFIEFVFSANNGKTERQKSLKNTVQMTCADSGFLLFWFKVNFCIPNSLSLLIHSCCRS